MAKIISSYVEKEISLDMPKGDRSGATDTFADGGGDGKDETRNDFPSRVNTDKQKSTEDKTLQQFRSMYAEADKEHAFTVDDQGYITVYKHGNSSSVSWNPSEMHDRMIYHNHSNDTAFSKGDLLRPRRQAQKGLLQAEKRAITFIRTSSAELDIIFDME